MNPRIPFIAAPVLTFAYGVIRVLDGLDGERGPGLAWTAGHLVFIAAMVMFLLVFGHLRRIAGWTPLLLLVDLVMPLVDKDLIPIGAAALLISFASISRWLPARTEPARV